MLSLQTQTLSDVGYPKRLLQLPKPPPVLWQKGTWDETKPSIAIVGARACKKQSETLAENLAYELAQAGIAIVSGGALGIDAAAHQGALRACGFTCAVLGTGLDILYPMRNLPLFEKMVQQNGCLFSPFAPQTQAKSWHFPKRNELIAALSDGVILIDSSPSSGSRYTAITAFALKKPLFVLSGALDSKDLLEKGAYPIHTSQEIVNILAPSFPQQLMAGAIKDPFPPPTKLDMSFLTEQAQQLYAFLYSTPITIYEVSFQSKLPLPVCIAALSELEIYGFCVQLPGERYQTCS